MHRNHERMGRKLVALAAALGLAYAPMSPRPAGAQSADDIFLLTTATAPNVVLLMDNSEAMNHIEWHPKFDPDAGSYGCSDFTNGTEYTYTGSKPVEETHCGNTREIFVPESKGTHWDGRYLNWYFSDDADAYINDIENAVANIEGCTDSSGAAEFSAKFRRTRFHATKQVLLDTLCVAEPVDIRFGLAQFREPADAALEDPVGGFVSSDLGRSNPNHASELESQIKNSDTTTGPAPLAEAYFQISTYFMPRDTTDLPVGEDGVTQFPPYAYPKDGEYESSSNKWFEDALEFDCENAYVVIISAGGSTRDDFDGDPPLNAGGFSDFANLVGDFHDEGDDGVADVELPGDADESGFYLDDIAKYMQENDLRPDLDGEQVIDTYTIAISADQAAKDYLEMTAQVGNGLFYETQDGDQLTVALIAALNDIIEKSSTFTSASVPAARTADGGDFYQSFFIPSGGSATWEGHIRAWRINVDGEIVDANDDCALLDPDPNECNGGPFDPGAVYFWDAAEEIPLPDSRILYASKTISGTSTRVAFDDALTAADLTVQTFTVAGDPAPNNTLYPTQGSTAISAEGLADEAVAFARGCLFGTGVTNASLVNDPQSCVPKSARLGDIFHSSPTIVRHPISPSNEDSYKAFKTAYAARYRVMYAGTNTGFLEAFHTGDWQAGDTPPKYDEGTGVELFGFMPWASRQTIKRLPVDFPTSRTHYVDGPPQISDVWIHPSATSTTKNADGREWRTMLVTGLRRGGRHYLALDITNPGDTNNPNGITGPGGVDLEYPGFQASGPAYGWEFPSESDPDGWLTNMGETWSKPVITRVRVSVNGDGIGHERWVAIFAGGYDAGGDPNPSTISGISSTYSNSALEGRAIFIIDMKTGKVLGRKILDASALDDQDTMDFAMPSNPAVFDLDGDGFADVIYVGDLGGQVFKWVIHPVGGDPINGSASGDDVNQPSWPFKLFFEAPVQKFGGDNYYRNIYFAPAGALLDGNVWLAFGSGERRSLGYTGASGQDENNRLYVVKDSDPLEVAASPLPTMDEGDLVDGTDYPGGVANTNGFYIKGADGEKFVTNTVIFAGQVITNSFTPTPSADPCAGRGLATAYVFDLTTGEGFFTDVNGDPERTLDLGVGLPTDPKISVNVGSPGGGGGGGPGPCSTGQGNRVYIEKSDSGIESFGTCDVPVGGQLLYWREVQ